MRPFIIAVLAATLLTANAYADTASDLNQKIADTQKLIDQYSVLLNATSKQAQTLTSALKTLDLTQKKLEANLSLTTRQISKTSLTLSDLSKQINETQAKIGGASEAIALGMRQMAMAESQTVIESLLSQKSISDTWDYINGVRTLQNKVSTSLTQLEDLNDTLQAQKEKATGERAKLVTYQASLADQGKLVAVSKQEKDQLLAETQNKAATYNKILADKIAQRTAYEKELADYEAKLQAVNPGSVPNAKHSILSWPLSDIRITQYFGKTAAARLLYKISGTHNGVDFGVSIGTPVYAALSGTITDTEPTKARSGCQYGKYVLIKHANGLSTIYGHLSVVKVVKGATVNTGDLIGYSGDTGYATGPHLHFGLYITAGIQIVDSSALGSKTCAGIKTVASPAAGYLDPMAYLPKL